MFLWVYLVLTSLETSAIYKIFNKLSIRFLLD